MQIISDCATRLGIQPSEVFLLACQERCVKGPEEQAHEAFVNWQCNGDIKDKHKFVIDWCLDFLAGRRALRELERRHPLFIGGEH